MLGVQHLQKFGLLTFELIDLSMEIFELPSEVILNIPDRLHLIVSLVELVSLGVVARSEATLTNTFLLLDDGLDLLSLQID